MTTQHEVQESDAELSFGPKSRARWDRLIRCGWAGAGIIGILIAVTFVAQLNAGPCTFDDTETGCTTRHWIAVLVFFSAWIVAVPALLVLICATVMFFLWDVALKARS